jgi:hypothetical protein
VEQSDQVTVWRPRVAATETSLVMFISVGLILLIVVIVLAFKLLRRVA